MVKLMKSINKCVKTIKTKIVKRIEHEEIMESLKNSPKLMSKIFSCAGSDTSSIHDFDLAESFSYNDATSKTNSTLNQDLSFSTMLSHLEEL